MDFIDKIKPLNTSTVVALGYFDGVHLGHREVIKKAIEEAKVRSVSSAVLTFDMTNRRANAKGKDDLDTYSQRTEYMQQLGLDILVQLDFNSVADMTSESFVRDILGDSGLGAVAVCCGADFRFGNQRSGDIDQLREICYELGIDVVVVGEVEINDRPISTTLIKQFIKLGEIERAVQMLGRGYSFKIVVSEGKKLARKLGFPTINQKLPKNIVVPKFGVYCSMVTIDAKRYIGVSNLGLRPTVQSNGDLVLETHILDFSGDLYGIEVEVELVSFIRDETKFSGESELKAQVEKDIGFVKNALKI